MKKAILPALAGAMLFLGACSSEEPVKPEASLQKGEPTYTAFSIKMNTPAARAAEDDDNADAVEQSISDINIYIFSGGVLEVMSKPEINDYVTVPVAVSTGEKVIYAVATDLLDGDNAIAFTEESTLLTTFESTLFNALEEKTAQSEAFTMIGRTKATITKCTEAQALQNPVKIDVDRAAAKLQVKYGEGVTVRETLKATFGSACFTPAQQARQMYVTLGSNYTPLGTAIRNNGTYPGLLSVAAAYADEDMKAAVEAYDAAFEANAYTGECVVAAPTTGNTTFALVRVKCTPTGKLYGNKTLPADGTFWVAARNYAETATWIFASDAEYNMIYFANETDAKKYITDNKLGSDYKAYKYDKGQAYYRVNLMNDPESEDLSLKYRVVRNNYYRVNITAIKALGAPTGTGVVPTDPDTPIEQDSWMAAEITVKPWTAHEQNTELQ